MITLLAILIGVSAGPPPTVVASRAGGQGSRLDIVVFATGDQRRAYAAVRLPAGPPPPAGWPLVVVFYAGFEGASVPLYFDAVTDAVPSLTSRVALAMPAHRGEALRVPGWPPFESEGAPDPWGADVKDAVALVAQLPVAISGLDTSRVALIGTSRGGALALLSATAVPAVRAVVAVAAPTDLTALGPPPVALASVDTPERRRARSPLRHARGLPPTRLMHDADDPVVPISHALRFAKAARAAGVDCQRVDAPPFGHNPLLALGALGSLQHWLTTHLALSAP